MTSDDELEQTFGSTRYAWKRVKVSPPPAGQTTARRRRSSFLRLPRADRTRPVRIEILYRGGAESWWLVKARGEHQVFPGCVSLDDLMARVLSER
jgi:hypothetical protein